MYGSGSLASPRSRTYLLLAACLAQLLIVFDSNAIAIALPTLEGDLQMRAGGSQWVAIAFSLAFAATLATGGGAVDRLGARPVLTLGATLFALSAMSSASADVAGVLIGSRALQGASAGLLFPAALTLAVGLTHEGSDRNRVLGIFGTTVALGFTGGILVGGVISEVGTWRWLFLVEGAMATVLLIAAGVCHLPAKAQFRLSPTAGHTLLVTGALVAVIYGLTAGASAGWTSVEVLVGLGVAAVLAGVSLAIAKRSTTARPSPAAGTMATRWAAVAAAATVATGAGTIFIMSFYLQRVAAVGTLATAAILSAFGVAAILSGGAAAGFGRRVCAINLLWLGLLLQATGCAVTAIAAASASGLIPVGLAVLGVGHVQATVGFTRLATTGTEHATGGVGATLSAAQQVGASVGVAIAVALASTHGRLLIDEGGGGGATPLAQALGALAAVSAFVGLAILVARRSRLASATKGL